MVWLHHRDDAVVKRQALANAHEARQIVPTPPKISRIPFIPDPSSQPVPPVPVVPGLPPVPSTVLPSTDPASSTTIPTSSSITTSSAPTSTSSTSSSTSSSSTVITLTASSTLSSTTSAATTTTPLDVVVTVTSTTAAAPTLGDMGPAPPPKGFLQNKPLSGAVFGVVGIIAVVAITALAILFIRRAQAKKLLRQAISFDPGADYSDRERGSIEPFAHSERGSSHGHESHTAGARPTLPFSSGPAYPQQAISTQAHMQRDNYMYASKFAPGYGPSAVPPPYGNPTNPIFDPTHVLSSQAAVHNAPAMAQASAYPGRNLLYQPTGHAAGAVTVGRGNSTRGKGTDEASEHDSAYNGLTPDTARVLTIANK